MLIDTKDLVTEAGLRRYYAELRPGDRPWAALHPCHDRAPDVDDPANVPQVTVLSLDVLDEFLREYYVKRGQVPVAWEGVYELLGADPSHAPFGLYPTRELAAEARRKGIAEERASSVAAPSPKS